MVIYPLMVILKNYPTFGLKYRSGTVDDRHDKIYLTSRRVSDKGVYILLPLGLSGEYTNIVLKLIYYIPFRKKIDILVCIYRKQ